MLHQPTRKCPLVRQTHQVVPKLNNSRHLPLGVQIHRHHQAGHHTTLLLMVPLICSLQPYHKWFWLAGVPTAGLGFCKKNLLALESSVRFYSFQLEFFAAFYCGRNGVVTVAPSIEVIRPKLQVYIHFWKATYFRRFILWWFPVFCSYVPFSLPFISLISPSFRGSFLSFIVKLRLHPLNLKSCSVLWSLQSSTISVNFKNIQYPYIRDSTM